MLLSQSQSKLLALFSRTAQNAGTSTFLFFPHQIYLPRLGFVNQIPTEWLGLDWLSNLKLGWKSCPKWSNFDFRFMTPQSPDPALMECEEQQRSTATADVNDLALSLHSGISISAGIYSRLTRVSVILSLGQCLCCTKALASSRPVPVRTRMS